MEDGGGMSKGERMKLHIPSDLVLEAASLGDEIMYKIGNQSSDCLVSHS